jgi:hypothetical protein
MHCCHSTSRWTASAVASLCCLTKRLRVVLQPVLLATNPFCLRSLLLPSRLASVPFLLPSPFATISFATIAIRLHSLLQMIWNGLHKDWIASQEAKRAAAEAAAAADTTAAAVAAENRAAVAAREARDGGDAAEAAADEVRRQPGEGGACSFCSHHPAVRLRASSHIKQGG